MPTRLFQSTVVSGPHHSAEKLTCSCTGTADGLSSAAALKPEPCQSVNRQICGKASYKRRCPLLFALYLRATANPAPSGSPKAGAIVRFVCLRRGIICLRACGVAVAALRACGVAVAALRACGVAVAALRACGVAVTALRACGVAVAALRACGVAVAALRACGVAGYLRARRASTSFSSTSPVGDSPLSVWKAMMASLVLPPMTPSTAPAE